MTIVYECAIIVSMTKFSLNNLRERSKSAIDTYEAKTGDYMLLNVIGKLAAVTGAAMVALEVNSYSPDLSGVLGGVALVGAGLLVDHKTCDDSL